MAVQSDYFTDFYISFAEMKGYANESKLEVFSPGKQIYLQKLGGNSIKKNSS